MLMRIINTMLLPMLPMRLLMRTITILTILVTYSVGQIDAKIEDKKK